VQRALDIGRGTGAPARCEASPHRDEHGDELPRLRARVRELDPRLFSFNSPHGACEECGGFGEIWNRREADRHGRNGESVLENELAAERESEGIEEGEAKECPACHGSR
jgi:excinuclease ABC subunit A